MLFKVLVIPFAFVHGLLFFLMVHDAQHREWSFISGGKKLNESMERCASRELYEESKGVLQFHEREFENLEYFDTRVLHSTTHHSMFKLNTFYRVYFLPLAVYTEAGLRSIEDRFRKASYSDREMNENDDMRFFPHRDLKHLPTMWEFIRDLLQMDMFKQSVRRLGVTQSST